MSSSQAPSTVPAALSTPAAAAHPAASEPIAAADIALGTGNAKQMSTPWALGPPIRVGDVGFLCDDVFCRLFNAALPADDPAQRALGVPRGFEPLPVPLEAIEVHSNLPEQTVGVQHWFVHSFSRLSFASWMSNMIGLEQSPLHQPCTI
jgi:hypothetical protein